MAAKIIDLDEARLLRRWEDVRRGILSGHVKAFALSVRLADDSEVVYLAGDYEADPEEALRAAMRMSIELNHRT